MAETESDAAETAAARRYIADNMDEVRSVCELVCAESAFEHGAAAMAYALGRTRALPPASKGGESRG